jgi:cation diffusion facilitator CzcD-associated flavoprotein CzcO
MNREVIILGSGFSGLGMAIALQREGKRSYVILEKGSGVGGTWRENRYPGCACDVPSHLYSFSFAQNAEWSHHFAPQREILGYLEDCARKYGVLEHCRFGAEAKSCEWDEASGTWQVTTASGEVFRGAQLVLGVGGLHHPKFPDVPGREKFSGPQLHSALWDDSVQLEGKRVAVIGTGASAIQLVPALAPRVKQLTLFQRTPAWVIPRADAPISRFAKWLYRVAPWLMKVVRARIYWKLESRALAFTRWPGVLRAAEWLSKRHLRKQVNDPSLRERLTPKYAAGCKRILLSDDYFPAFNRPNVTLESSAVKEVTASGVVTPDGRHVACDAIVWCTGFDVAAPLSRMKVIGREGKDLGARWGERLRAYRGTTVPGFPNMFVLMGPNTGLGHNSMVYMIESQIQFVLAHLRALDAAGAKSVEVTEEAERAFNEGIDTRLPGTIWATGCSSWYLDEKGRNVMLWPGATFSFRKLTREVELKDLRMKP